MSPQQSIAHYKIVSKLGEGGMGAVYRATDTRLNRDVAIKVLPDSFAGDPDRLARLKREAQILAGLNHPNIAAIFGVEDRALVMELVEGADLAGPLSEEQALPIIQQLVDALEYAHEKGVVHRDLKPANIKVTPEGRAKVLDFGLAKAVAAESAPADPRSSPTLSMTATQKGMILGTASYMAPEQARGHAVDKRADIWAFGVVVYELLCGRQVFPGETVSDALAAVLRKEVDLDQIPPRFRRLLGACLERDPRRRMRDIGDARLLLQEPVPAAAAPIPPAHAASRLPWAAAAALGLAAATLAFLHFRQPAASAPIMRFGVPAPEDAHFNAWLALSPDGHNLGFTAISPDGSTRIWIRGFDSLEARALPGSEGVNTFFWSPDSRSVAFVSDGKLKRMEISGGPPQNLCNGPSAGLGGAWNAEGVILFGGTGGPIMRVSAAGGDAEPVTALASDDVMHIYPVFLSDGHHFLYLRRTDNRKPGIFAGSLDTLPSAQNERPVLQPGIDLSFGYTPPDHGSVGHILFLRRGTLVAQEFDEKSFRLVGEPVPLAESISTNLSRAAFGVSPAGVLAYRTGSDSTDVEYVWFDREGRTLGQAGQPGLLRSGVALSPDGARLAHGQGRPPARIAILDLARGIDAPLTSNPEGASTLAWSPDGKWIAYSSSGSGSTIYLKDAANGAAERILLQSPSVKYVTGWSPDGRFLLYSELSLGSGLSGLWALPDPLGSGERKPVSLSEGRFSELQAAISPDGRWLAYVSTESGTREIYARPFPPGDGRSGRVKVSPAGGVEPRWRADGRELYYRAPDGKLMATDMTTAGAVLQLGVPHALFATPSAADDALVYHYDVARDGKRFLLAVSSPHSSGTPITLVLNWESALRK